MPENNASIMPEGKTTSTQQMMIMFFLSVAALVFNILALIGYFAGFTLCVDVGFGNPVCQLSIFGAWASWYHLSVYRPFRGTHVRPDGRHLRPLEAHWPLQVRSSPTRFVLATRPFQLMHMMLIQAVLNCIGGILTGFTMGGTWWAGLMAFIAGICYAVNVLLVFKHFQNPNVPTSLNLEYGAGGGGRGGGASSSAVKSLEEKVKKLETLVEALSKKVDALESK